MKAEVGLGSAYPGRAPRAGIGEMERFVIAAAASGLLVLGFAIWVGLQLGGAIAAGGPDDLGPALAALVAAVGSFVTARRSKGRRRVAWTLVGTAAFSWGVGAAVTGMYQLALGRLPPVPSIADVGYLAAYPLALAGVMVVPTAPRRISTRGRAVIDAGILASALLFIGLSLGLGGVYRGSTASSLALWITNARPLADIVILTFLALAVLNGIPRRRGRLVLWLAGFAAIAASDTAYAVLTANGTFSTKTDIVDTGWVCGFVLITLSTLWPLPSGNQVADERAAGLWQVAVPFLSLVTVALTTLVITATGHHMDVFVAFPGAALGILLTASQLLTHRDSLVLLSASKRAESQLREQGVLLNQVIGHTPAGLARIGLEMRFMDANPRLIAIFRAPTRVIVGSSLTDYLPASDVSKVFGSIPAVSDEMETVEAHSEALRADGSKLWVHWSATPVRNPRGAIEYFLGMFDDVTPEHDADAAAMANLASLERLNKLKSEFVTMVSHEFRTALTGIQGYSEVMRDDTVTAAEVKEFAGDINTDAVRLSRMITEMLDLDRMEAGRMKLNLGQVDINRLLTDAAGRARVASSKHVITVQLGGGLPTIVGDSDRLFQVVTNLLSNAIKYSPAGGEIVMTSSFDASSVRVGVRDHGAGIPPEFIDRLFGRYERYEGNATSQVIGTGLGLAIARQIVDMHRGRIWVESTLGVGSEFIFTLPVEAGMPMAAPAPTGR